MQKRKIYTYVGIIFILAFFAINLDYPKYFNQGVDFLNSKTGLNLPHFWQLPFKLGLDLQGGVLLVYESDLSNIEPKDYDSSMQGLRDVIERRVNLFGVREPIVQVQGERLIVELAGVKDVSEAIREIGKTPYLEFKQPKENYQEILERNQEVWEAGEDQYEDPYELTSLTGKYLKKAETSFDQTTYQPLVLLRFNDEGSKIFEDLTLRNVGKPLAIYIDGILVSSPIVQEKISGGKAQISGGFTIEEAKELTRNLNAGALPVPIGSFDPETGEFKSGEPLSHRSVGPSLGAISLEKSLKAGALGFLAVILFMIFFYRVPGILASLALGTYVALVLALFKLIPITLTLAGIGGFILSIGMAIDANILIFSRMREELKEGKSFSQSIEEGFRRAWPSIRDGNLTTLLVAGILFGFGTGFIQGFALTLSIGILLSMFSAIFITKNFLRIFIGTRLEKFNWLWM